MQFFNHFRKDFIRPYGLAHDENSFEHKILMRRLNSWNYKFYLHPQIAISEFTQTISQNVKYLEENIDILDQHSLTPSIKKTKKIDKHLAVLHSKNTGVTGMFIYHKFCLTFVLLIY